MLDPLQLKRCVLVKGALLGFVGTCYSLSSKLSVLHLLIISGLCCCNTVYMMSPVLRYLWGLQAFIISGRRTPIRPPDSIFQDLDPGRNLCASQRCQDMAM